MILIERTEIIDLDPNCYLESFIAQTEIRNVGSTDITFPGEIEEPYTPNYIKDAPRMTLRKSYEGKIDGENGKPATRVWEAVEGEYLGPKTYLKDYAKSRYKFHRFRFSSNQELFWILGPSQEVKYTFQFKYSDSARKKKFRSFNTSLVAKDSYYLSLKGRKEIQFRLRTVIRLAPRWHLFRRPTFKRLKTYPSQIIDEFGRKSLVFDTGLQKNENLGFYIEPIEVVRERDGTRTVLTLLSEIAIINLALALFQPIYQLTIVESYPFAPYIIFAIVLIIIVIVDSLAYYKGY